MMNIVRIIHSCLVFLLLMFYAGCVGTVQEAKAPDTLKLVNPPATFPFPGIVNSRPISHNKVELEFYPAASPSAIYKLYINSSDQPVPIDPQSLMKAAAGRLLYTVEELLPDREYKFKLVAEDVKTGAISTEENEAFARTFDNLTANFKGISKVSLVPGNTHGAVLVDWISPIMQGVFTSGPYDPAHYEVSIISSIGGLANLNNPHYAGTDRRVILVPSPPLRVTPLSNPTQTVIDGLSPGTTYYLQVRAINTLYQNYAEDPNVTIIPVNREVNTRFLTIKTDNAGSLFDFRQDNVVVANAPGIDAFDKIDIFWQPGSGSFSNYKIFIRKYDGIGDPTIDDKLTEAMLISLAASNGGPGAAVYSVASNFTNKRATGLDSYGVYQVKVALCKNITCPMASADPQASIISDLESIIVQPTLAPFTGISGIYPPALYIEKDTVKLKFDAPLVGSGFANAMEFYCVDPDDQGQQVKFDGSNPIVGSGIARCDGLYLDGPTPPITTYTFQKVRGLVTNGTVEYCFAATPAIIGYTPELRMNPSARIVRCSYPEIFPPTVAQFPGIKNSCLVSGVNGDIDWNLPTGGIYSGFKVYWKEKIANVKFSFPDAIAGNPGYFNSGDLPTNQINYSATNLMPGRTYQIGVLAVTDMDPPVADLYSEYNLKVMDCVVPLPIASFQGFSRIFAVGPKVDGRAPNDPSTKAPPVSAWLHEAVDAIGQIYEVAMTTNTVPSNTLNYTPPPGRDITGADFTQPFDGISNSFGLSLSKTGIVSLAWEDVKMDFPEADTIFAHPTSQPASPAPRVNRKFGYKIYRSTDNKLTWKELTSTTGLIYSIDYTYKHRSNASTVTKRMGFFTDYSVQAMDEVHDVASSRDIDRARIYDYKIVPIFDGKALTYASPNHNIVRVTLPPPNMALVHRWMANRSRCLEMDKTPNISANYSCTYNGIGSAPMSIPHRVGNTALDQGGDLLVDRFELGCRYTRGDPITASESGASYFSKDTARRNGNDDNFWPMFQGYRTIGTNTDATTPFRGCGGIHSRTKGANGVEAEYPALFTPEYSRIIQGDCIGEHLETQYLAPCSTANLTAGYVLYFTVMTPGLSNSASLSACDADTASNPKTIQTKLMGQYAPNWVMQSEFLAVFHNTYGGAGLALPFEGPSSTGLNDIALRNELRHWNMNNCSVNLAAIDGTGVGNFMKPRWLSLDHLHTGRTVFKGATGPLYSKTVAELTEVRNTVAGPLTFYNGTDADCGGPGCPAYKLPPSSLRTSPRYRPSTRISRVMASNTSKLPPISKLSSEQAQYLCNNFFVQVGFAADNGSFAPEQAVKPKRSLRRVEHITASAWNETYDEVAVDNIETGSNLRSCNNAVKNNPGSNIVKGNFQNNRVAYSTPIRSPIITGSSQYTGLSTQTDGFNTSACVSKYGIQDMVGNATEYNSDRIFCDYTQDAIWMGPVNGSWDGGNAIINKGTGDPQFGFWNTNTERDEWWIAKNGVLANTTAVNFKLTFANGDPDRTDLKPWAQIGTDSGYCSPVDGNPTKRTSPVDAFKDISTGIWSPVFLPGGAINPSIIEHSFPDQEAVYGWRNGDGRFLDFGPQGIGASVNKANTLSFLAAAGNKYFNPIIGLPLKCQNGTCQDSSLDPPYDNTEITTDTMKANIVVGVDMPVNPDLADFPIGNSVIAHAGISEFKFSATGFDSITVVPTGESQTVLTEMRVTDPVGMTEISRTTKNYPTDFLTGSTLEFFWVRWDVYRGTNFTLTSGGSSIEGSTGRYSAEWVAAEIYGLPTNAGTATLASGARCGILVNQD